MSLLIVEDNAISARILEVNLKKGGYDTVVAPAAKDAFKVLLETSGIRLIITDIMMPEMDGLEFVKQIKECWEWNEIPVIVCSALGDAESIRKANLLGVRHYLVKPIHPGLLLQKVAEVLSGKKTVLRERQETMLRFGLDEESYAEVSKAFGGLVMQQISLLQEHSEKRPTERVQLALGALCEGASVLGADRLMEVIDREFIAEEEAIAIKGWLPKYRLALQELKLVAEALASES